MKRRALDGELGAMRVGDPSSNGETEAVAGVRFSLAKVGLVEAIEDVLAHVFGHTDSGVAHDDEGVVVGAEDFGADFARFGCVTDRIVEEDSKEALEKKFVAFDVDGFGRKMPVENDSAGFGEVFYAAAAADYEFAEIDFLEGDFVDKVVALREGEKGVE